MSEGTISAWMPEQDQHRLAALGKLIEELNEAGIAATRCIIQGIDEIDPSTGRTNRAELEHELADVEAAMHTATVKLGLEIDYDRADAKARGFDRWHELIDSVNARVEPSESTLADRVARGETVL